AGVGRRGHIEQVRRSGGKSERLIGGRADEQRAVARRECHAEPLRSRQGRSAAERPRHLVERGQRGGGRCRAVGHGGRRGGGGGRRRGRRASGAADEENVVADAVVGELKHLDGVHAVGGERPPGTDLVEVAVLAHALAGGIEQAGARREGGGGGGEGGEGGEGR